LIVHEAELASNLSSWGHFGTDHCARELRTLGIPPQVVNLRLEIRGNLGSSCKVAENCVFYMTLFGEMWPLD
jgi:hypothetical protein